MALTLNEMAQTPGLQVPDLAHHTNDLQRVTH